MERDTNQMSQSPSLCRSGCGFYGNPSSDGLCSKCYKDALKRKQAAPTTASSSSSHSADSTASNIRSALISPSLTSVSTSVSAISAQESSQSQTEVKIELLTDLPKASTSGLSESVSETPKIGKKKKLKCGVCRSVLGIIVFDCRCGGVFCNVHRYAKEHNCTFNYKEHGAEEIRKNNPQVIGEKVQKI